MKSSDLHIRRLVSSDAPAYRALRLRALRDHPEAFTSSYEEDVTQGIAHAERRLAAALSGRFWGAFLDGQMVGMVGLDRETRAKNRHKGVVVGMYVAPEQARMGIARVLMDALLQDAQQEGLELLVLTVTSGNHGAENLYFESGFQSFGMEPRAIKVQNRYFDKNHMYLLLSSP